METRHTLHRTLRSGGTAPRQQLMRERGRSRSAKLPVGKIREKGSDADKPEDVEGSVSSTIVLPNEATAKSSLPQNKKTQNDARPVGSRETSKSPLTKRTKVEDRTPGLTLRGRSIHSLKSRVDWSRNAELSPEQPAKASAASEGDQTSSLSSVSLRSKSTNSPSQSPAAKILDAPSTAAGRLKSVRQMSAGRSRQNSPSQSPIARVKSTSSGRTSPLNQSDAIQMECSAASTVKVQATEQVKRQGRLTGRSSTLTDNPAVGTPPVKKLAKASTRSTSAPRLVETDNESIAIDKLANRQISELRSTPPARRLRTNSSSPVTRTRPGAPKGRLPRPNIEKTDDKNVKELTTLAPVANIETTDSDAAGDEEVEGDADSVTRPPVCSSSSPESDHNYAKAEVADEPSSSKVAVVGKPYGNEGPLSEAGLGGDETGVKDGLETVVGGDCFKAKRVLRGRLRYLDTSKQTTVKEVMEPCPKVSSGKGFIDEEALHGKDAEAGKVIALQRLAIDPPMADDQKRSFEKETKERFSPFKVLRGTKRLGPPSSKIRKPLLQSLRQRKPNSKYMLQMIKSTLSKESKSSADNIQVKQIQTKDKSLTKSEKPDDDDDVLPALTDVKLPRTSFSGRRPRRNLFEQFSTKSNSTSHNSASFSAVGSRDVAMSVVKEKEPKIESTESAIIRSDKSSTFNTDLSRQEEIDGDQSRKLKLNRNQTNKQQVIKQTRSKTDTKDATHSCIHPDTEKIRNGNMKNANPDSKADPNRTEKSKISRKLSRHGGKQKSVANLQRNADLQCENAESQHCTSTPISNGCEQTDTMITQMQLGTPESTNEGGEGLASLSLCVSNDTSKSSLGYQDTIHQLEGPIREPVTVSDDGRDGKSEVKLGTRKLRGLKPRDSPAETPIHSHLTTKSSLYRRPQQKADKSVSQGPGGEAEAPREDGDSTNNVPDVDVEGQPPAGRTRAGRSGRSRPITTGSLPITDLKDLSVTDRVNKHTRRSSMRKPKGIQNNDTPTVLSEPGIENVENIMVTHVVDVRKTRKSIAKTIGSEESGEKLDTVTDLGTQSTSDSVTSDVLVAPEPSEESPAELPKVEEKSAEVESVVAEPLVKETASSAPVFQEKRRRGRPSQTKVEAKRLEVEPAVEFTIDDTPHPGPVMPEKRRRGRHAVPKVEEKKIEVQLSVEPVTEEAAHQDPVIHEKRRPGRPALPKVSEEKKTEMEHAEESVTEETRPAEPTIQEKKRQERHAIPTASEEKRMEPAVEPEIKKTAHSDPAILEKRRPGRHAIPKVSAEKTIAVESATEPITEDTTQAELMIQEKKEPGENAIPAASEEKLEPVVEPVTGGPGEPQSVIQEKIRAGRETSPVSEEKKAEVEHDVESVTEKPAPPEAERVVFPTDSEEKTIDVGPPVESMVEETFHPVPLIPEKRRPGRPVKRRRLKSVKKQESSDSESHKERPDDINDVADCKDIREPISGVTTDKDEQSENVATHDSAPSKEGKTEEVQTGKKDAGLLVEPTVDGATNETVTEAKSTNLAFQSQEEQVSKDTVIPQVVKRGRGRPKRIQPVATVVSETAARSSLQIESLNEDTSGKDLSMNKQLNSLTGESEVLKDEVKCQEKTVKMDMVETKVVVDTITSDEQISGDNLLVPQVNQSEKAVDMKAGASTANEAPEQKKRGRGRPHKHTVSVEITKSPAAKEVNKELPIRPAPRWKIPPPSPIRTRRLSKETVLSRRKIELTGIVEVSKESVHIAGEENAEQGSQGATNEVQTPTENFAVLAQPEPETLPNDQVQQPEEPEQARDNALTDLEKDSMIPPAPSDEVDSAKNIIQNIDSGAVDVENIELEVSKDSQGPLEPSTEAATDLVHGLPVVSVTVTDSSVTYDVPAVGTPEQLKESTEAAESTPTTAVVPEQSTPPTTATVQAVVSEPFTSVDELQVPFHDTDEAELSEILLQKDRDATPEEHDEGDGLKLYLEVESNQSDETKELVANGAQEVINDTEEQPSQEDLTAPKKLQPPSDSEPSVPSVSVQQDQDSKNIEPAKELIESFAQKEDTEVESIFAKGHENDSMVKEGHGHPTDTSIENSPSKSEWSARKVKTGMKIVLKLKRKGSSERSENNSPSTPTLADLKPHLAVSPSINDMKGGKVDAIGPASEMPLSVVTAEAKQNTTSLPVAELSPGNEEVRKRRKRRRNELEMLSVIDRAKRKSDDDNTSTTLAKMNDSDFTSDSTLATQSSTTDKECVLKFLDVQDDVKIEPKEEIKVETPVTSLSTVIEPSEVDQKKPKVEEVSKVEPHQKVEKLVIKRRVPSPTKMKTRGKQNRLWYLFAKQSKPSKEFVIPPVYKEHKAAPTGTLEELEALCKPCSVSLVDISFIMECRENMPGETSVSQSLDDQVDSTSDMDDEPPIIEGRPCPPDIYQAQTLDTPHDSQGVKRKPSPIYVGQQSGSDAKAVDIPSSHEESTPVSKKPRLQAGSDYETQYLSFVMKNSAPYPVLDKSVLKTNTPSEGATKSHAPKPVLTRAPVTARKSMKSAKYTGVGHQSREASPIKATILTQGSGGLHQEVGQSPPGMSSPGKFACLHCPYTSNVRSVMLEHVYIHTDFVPYACGHCSEAYGSRNGVVIHTKREHPGVIPDIVKNTEICEEDYYITCDTNKRTTSDPVQQSVAASHNSLSAGLEPSPSTCATSVCSSGKSVSLLNPAVLTAQVAATKVGLAASPSVTTAPVQLVVSTSRPTSTAPIVNVVGQVDPSVSGLQVLAPIKAVQGKEHSVIGASEGGKKSSRRPRIPLLVNVDPSQPYYQCRHCTFANNNLGSIRTHVETQHKGEQRYQCHRCELLFFKNSMTMEKHYAKLHPGEPVSYALQADFYDVHQDGGDKAKAIHDSVTGLQNRGQSPLHVIVSPDGVTLLGATEVSPAASMASPQMSPPMARTLTSPGPAHCKPHPVLSPPSLYPPGQGPTPPPAHSGSSPAPSPHSQQYYKPGPACSKSSRVILKVPTISPPQRSLTQTHHTKSAAPQVSPPKVAVPQVVNHDHSKPLLQSPISSTHSPVSGTSNEAVDILNLTTSSSCPSPGLDLSKKPEAEPASATEESTTMSEDTSSEVVPPNKQMVADDSHPEVTEAEIALPLPGSDVTMLSADDAHDFHSVGPSDSPPPLMIMNVMSLAGQTDSELHPDECVASIDDQEPSQNEAYPDGAETYTCTTCDAAFKDLDSVISHVGEVHKLQYWYACPYCPFGCSRSKMLQHICRAHSDQPADVPINIIDEEKYFIRSQPSPKQSESNLNCQSSGHSQADADEELDIESEQAKEKADITQSPDANDVTVEEKAPEQTGDDVTTSVPEPKTSEKGCSTDDIPCKQPPAPSRVVQLDEEDVVIVAEHRKQRPVGQIRPTMVRAPNAVQGFRRLGSSGNFQQQVQAVSPITVSPKKPVKPTVTDLDMDCENVAEQPRPEEVTEDDDIIVTETKSSVISIPPMDQPLDLHQPKQSTSGVAVLDEPTDLSVSRSSSRQSTGDEPQDLSLTAHNLTKGSTNLSRSSSSSPSVIKSPALHPRPGGSRESSVIRSPPPAHQSAQRSVPPLVIEPIPSLPGSRHNQPWGTPILIAPLPQTSHKDNHAGTKQPLPAHTHKQSPRGSVLSAHAGAPNLPSSHRPVTSVSHKGVSNNTAHKSSAPHRPVSKTMPPLIQISQQSEKGNSKPLNVGSSHGTVKSVMNSSSVIQALPNSSHQSALTSLEQMTKRSGSDLGKRPPSASSKKLVDNQFADEEAARKAYSVFNLKPKMRPTTKPAATGSVKQTQQTFGAMGINKWQQFQSQNRPQVRPQPQQAPRPSFPGPQPGSLGMAAAAFQQAHMRRSGVNPTQVGGLPQMSSATAAAAAASFMQRQPSPASNQGFSTTAKTPTIQCPYCKFTAEDADTIHDHILSHAPNIQWSCPYCPLPNRMTKASVTKHMQNCHPKSNLVYIPYGVPLI